MSIFKKKPPIEQFIELTPKFDVPEIIKESKIKPTKCARCHSVYQAKIKHLFFDRDFNFIDGRVSPITVCPICRMPNDVEFEEAEE